MLPNEKTVQRASRFFEKPSDLEILIEWWTARGWPVPENFGDFLPEHGIVIEEENESVAMGFVMKTNTPMAIFVWPTTKPGLSVHQSTRALEILFEEASAVAKSLGFKKMLAALSHEKLANFMLTRGFHPADRNVTTIMKEL